jgi:hypothetical protein
MKFKASIMNEVNGRVYQGAFDSIEQREEYVNRTINKKVLGEGQRKMLMSEVPQHLINRIISTENEEVSISRLNENGEEIVEVKELLYALIKSDFKVELSEENNYKELREREYPSMGEVLHILLDHGLESAEFASLQERRQLIKNKYPKA